MDGPARANRPWRLADRLGPLRLTLLRVSSIIAVGATIVIGVLALYLARLVVMLVGAFLLVPRQSLVNALGHQVGVGGVVALAWLATPVATVAR